MLHVLVHFFKKCSLFGVLVNLICGNCVCIFFLFGGRKSGEGILTTWDALIFTVWVLLMETCAAGEGPVCAFVDQASVSVFRVLACERVLGEPRGHVSVGPVYPVFGSQSPPLPLFILPPPHPRAAPQRLASPSHPATGSPLPLSLVLGSSRTLPVSFLSLDSQGGFSSCVSSS